MRTILLFFLFTSFFSAQNAEVIELKQNIKDKRGLTKSLNFIDSRQDKDIGSIAYKKESISLKFESEDLKKEIENWFAKDNKSSTGKNDISINLEELAVYKYEISKFKIKISSFIKRGDKYYFLNRYENVLTFERNASPKTVANQISSTVSRFIKDSYNSLPIGFALSEADLPTYETVLIKNLKIFNTNPLSDGVYVDYKSFRELKSTHGYHVVKNKKEEVVRIENAQDVKIINEDFFSFIDKGVPYKTTPVGYLEIFKDEKGLYIITNRQELYPPQSTGFTIGVAAGGIVGGMIGVMIDSQSRKNRKDSGFYNVYIDNLTGEYVFIN